MSILRILPLAALVWVFSVSMPVLAVEPDEMLDDPALEERAREISAGLRCVVCQNQSIDDSNAQLARDMRVLVRDRLLEGDSNEQVMDYIVSRYGDFVLLEPPVKTSTYVLWFGPVLIVALALLAFVTIFRRRSGTAVASGNEKPVGLSNEEQERIEALLKDTDDKAGGST